MSNGFDTNDKWLKKTLYYGFAVLLALFINSKCTQNSQKICEMICGAAGASLHSVEDAGFRTKKCNCVAPPTRGHDIRLP